MTPFWYRFLPASIRSKLESRSGLGHVAGNTGWQFGDNLLRMALGLVVGIWLARYLGPEQFGLFNYALAFVALFSALSSLGLDDIIVRDIVHEPGCRDTILGTAFFLKFIGGLISFLAILGTVFLLRPQDADSRWLVGVIGAGSVFQAFNVIEYWFHSQVQARYAVVARCSAFILCSLIKIGLILAEAPLIAFAWVALLEVLLGMSGLVIAYQKRSGSILKWRAGFDRAKVLLRDSWPLMLSSMVIMVYLRIDQIMLGEMSGNEEVGIYSVAVRLAEVWYFIPSALYWSLFPGVIEAKNLNDSLFYERLQTLYNLVVFSGYAVAIPVALVAQWLVPTLFGDAYGRAGLMLAVLIWSNVFTGMEMARSAFLTAMNWTRIYLVTVSLGCALNVALNSVLIPRYGGMGAVMASLIAYWFAAHGSCFLFKPLRRTGAMLGKALLYPKAW